MKKLLAVLMLPVAAGCLTSAEPEVTHWPVDISEARIWPDKAAEPKYGVARLSHLIVRSPYDAPSLAVWRPDGSMAFDPLNEYAAVPSLLLKAAAFDAFEESGLFAAVVGSASNVKTDHSIEITVVKLGLDCRGKNEGESGRQAVVELQMRVLADRAIVKTVRGAGRADAADGNFGRAFSAAYAMALSRAIGEL